MKIEHSPVEVELENPYVHLKTFQLFGPSFYTRFHSQIKPTKKIKISPLHTQIKTLLFKNDQKKKINKKKSNKLRPLESLFYSN